MSFFSSWVSLGRSPPFPFIIHLVYFRCHFETRQQPKKHPKKKRETKTCWKILSLFPSVLYLFISVYRMKHSPSRPRKQTKQISIWTVILVANQPLPSPSWFWEAWFARLEEFVRKVAFGLGESSSDPWSQVLGSRTMDEELVSITEPEWWSCKLWDQQ